MKITEPVDPQVMHLSALYNAGRYFDMEELSRELIKQNPNAGEFWKALGVALRMQGEGAVDVLQKAASLLPDDAQTHNALGIALRDAGKIDDAVMSYRRAVELNPDFAEAHNNLGSTLADLGHRDDAIASYRCVLEINPEFAEAHYNLANVLKGAGQFEDAVASYGRALEIKPEFADAHNNLGNALGDLGRFDEAVACHRRALELNPDFVEAHNNLGGVDSFRRALDIKPDHSAVHSNLLFTLNCLPDQSAAMLLVEARRFSDSVAQKVRPYTKWPNVRQPNRCLRLGLVSADLRNHPVGFFVEGILAALASNASGRLEFVAYANSLSADALTERIKSYCHCWRSVFGQSDERLAQQIREDRIDVLIDLSGHTAQNRLPIFAWKPAPVQISWLGYFATTGLTAIDYLIADPWTIPVSEERNFTEKIWRLPETRLCFTPPDVAVEVSLLPALENGYVTFGCFNNLSKMNDAVVALWAKVLHAVPESRLFLKSKQLSEGSMRQNVIDRFAIYGINGGQLTLEGLSPRPEYLSAYQRIDIALDPFPYPGGTTTVEALWMGVPVLTRMGDRFLSRQGVGLLMNAGLSDWIATDDADYVARAVSHARDLQRLSALRNGLRQQVLDSPLFDAPRFARHFESALREMWVQWCQQPRRKNSWLSLAWLRRIFN